jgi:hypothetical protein
LIRIKRIPEADRRREVLAWIAEFRTNQSRLNKCAQPAITARQIRFSFKCYQTESRETKAAPPTLNPDKQLATKPRSHDATQIAKPLTKTTRAGSHILKSTTLG